MTFLDAQNTLISLVMRPAGEQDLRDNVKIALRAAISYAQKMKNFAHAKSFAQIVWPANQDHVAIANVCNARVKRLENAQWLASPDENYGLEIPIVSYQEMMNQRSLHRQVVSYPTRLTQSNFDNRNYDSYQASRGPFQLMFQGNMLGLYPRPTTDQNILLYFTKWLPELDGDNDTNFLLDFGWDFLVMKACEYMNFWLKEDTRIQINFAIMTQYWNSLIEWDNTLERNSQPIDS